MISEGSNRDEGRRKGLLRRMEEEEAELEEGEACSFNNNNNFNNDDDVSIDPDVALSYIDEKLHNVLGHFQKDFEGGVSAENLGAKFGGYGSFLPTQKRSPVCSNPKTPPKIQNHALRSPSSLHLGVGHHFSAVSSSSPPYIKYCPDTTSVAVMASSANDSIKQDICMPSSRVQGLATKSKAKKKSADLPDLKTLKVRIKVGSDNLLTQKNAAIYSGLGLDVSPSSSLDDSPTESQGWSHEPENAPFESPNSILRIMTSFPIPGGLLLSPLPDDLVRLAEKEKLHRDRRSGSIPRDRQGSSFKHISGFDSMSVGGKVVGWKKMKSAEINGMSGEMYNGTLKDAHRNVGIISDKEVDGDASACDELVSQALKLPLISTLSYVGDDSLKGTYNVSETMESNEGVVKKHFLPKEEPRDSTSTQFVGSKEEKIHEAVKAELNSLVGRKALKSEEDDAKLPSVKEQSTLGGRKTSKGNQTVGTLAAEVPKENSRAGSSLSKSKKGTLTGNHGSKCDSINIKIQKDIRKGDRYRDFFGDMSLEQEENEVDSLDIPSEGKLKDSELVNDSNYVSNNVSKERSGFKKSEKPLTSETYQKSISSASVPAMGTVSEVIPTKADPVVHEDNWVMCDRCQTWRLLPAGKNPESLPEKWICSMLDWLPGMNRCDFSEEETTKAVITLYQIPVSENQSNMHSHPAGVLSGLITAGIQHPAKYQNKTFSGIFCSAKKKHGSTETSDAYNLQGSSQSVRSVKNLQSSVKSRSLNEVNQSPLSIDQDHQHLRMPAGKHRQKNKEKQKLLDRCSDGGNIKNSKSQNKRGISEDSGGAVKKRKAESNDDDENWMSDHRGSVRNEGPRADGFPIDVAGNDQSKINDSLTSNGLKCDGKDDLHAGFKNPKNQVPVCSDDMSYQMRKGDSRDSVGRKRKEKECQDARLNPGSLQSTRHDLEDSRESGKEYSRNDHRKDKKARLSVREVRESSLSKCSPNRDKKDGSKDHKLRQDPGSSQVDRSLDRVDSMKRDLLSVQPSTATSSSSKVSGSHRTKTSFQDMKGSPVESVSSSPLRPPNKDKYTSSGRSLAEKDEMAAADFLTRGSPRKCSDGENDGVSNRSGTDTKDKTSPITYHRSLDSPVLDQVSDHGKGKIVASSEFMNRQFVNGGADAQHYDELQASDRCDDDERRNDNHGHANGSLSRKSMKGSSSQSKDINRNSRSDFDKNNTFGTLNESKDHVLFHREKSKDGMTKSQQEFGVQSQRVDKEYVDKRNSAGKLSCDSSKRSGQSKSGGQDGQCVKLGSPHRKDELSVPKHKLTRDQEVEGSSKKLISDKTDPMENGYVGVKLVSLLLPGGAQNGNISHHPQQTPGSYKGTDPFVDASEGGDELKGAKWANKAENQTIGHLTNSTHPTPIGHRVRDLDAPSPARRDVSSQAGLAALKEAKSLKHMADRINNSGPNLEKTGLYFEAALKFLHGASLLESSNNESARHGEAAYFLKVYSSTADLFNFCAQEYEKFKNMAAAALAYKCTEVAYFRVIYSLHNTANRDRQELQNALQVAPPGESPSSSASDVDNLNNVATVDKISMVKGSGSPQVAGNHIISARNRPNLMRLLNFAQDIHLAMEASRKSQSAYAAAKVNLDVSLNRADISSIKRALDHNFQDIEGLLRLVRLAMEAMIH